MLLQNLMSSIRDHFALTLATGFIGSILVALGLCYFQPTIFGHTFAHDMHVAIHGAGLSVADLRGSVGQTSGLALQPVFQGVSMRTALIVLHLAGLVLGFGAAVFLDLFLLRYLLGRKIEQHTSEIAHFGAQLVAVGLAVLWISGIGFLALYFVDTPEKLSNPKIWAKVPIVIALTINGFVIHIFTLKLIGKKVGLALLEGESALVQRLLLTLGVISATSWAVAMLLGIVKEFNNTVSTATLLSGYALLALLGISVALAARPYLVPKPPKQILKGWRPLPVASA